MRQIYIRIRTEEQYEAVKNGLNYDGLICLPVLFESINAQNADDCLYLELPDIMRENMAEEIERSFVKNIQKARGVVIKNIDELGLLQSVGYKGSVIADPFLYAYNKEAVSFYREIFPEMIFVASDELTDAELAKEWAPDEVIYKIYGRQRVMFTAQDFRKNFGQKEDAQIRIESARKDNFVIVPEGDDYDTVMTELPVSMLEKIDELPWHSLLIDLTTEKSAELSELISTINSALTGGSGGQFAHIFGHHYKGID